MKALVIYYSHDGNTRLIAQAIAKATGADTLELKPTKEVASAGFAKFFSGGAQVMMKRTVFQDMKDALPGNSFVGEISFVDSAEKETSSSLQRASKWAKEITATLTQ